MDLLIAWSIFSPFLVLLFWYDSKIKRDSALGQLRAVSAERDALRQELKESSKALSEVREGYRDALNRLIEMDNRILESISTILLHLERQKVLTPDDVQ